MKKEWYIFINSSHIGPYSLLELRDFYDKRDIKDTTLMWKEGMSEWLPLKKLDLFSPLNNEVPPPLPPDVFLKEVKPSEAVSIPAILQTEREEPVEVQLPIKKKSRFLTHIIAAVSLFIILVAGVFVYKNTAKPDLRIKGVSPYNREQLENQLAIDERNMSFAIALSMDKSNLWISTNQKSNLSVTIDLKADPKRILADLDDNKDNAEVVVRLQGMIVNHLGHFTTMRMIKGDRFYPGEYNVHISGKKIHWLNQYLKLNKHDLNEEFTIDFKSLIYSGNAREFERKLVERHTQKISKLIKPLQDKLERLQTLKSLLEKNMELFVVNLEKSTTGKFFDVFEKEYIKEIGPIIQELVLSAHGDLEKDPEYKRYNEAIVDLGKRIGEEASEMITKISSLKKIDPKAKQKWKEYFQEKTDAIGAMIKIYIGQVDAQIKEIQTAK